jgi:hypothetical protein
MPANESWQAWITKRLGLESLSARGVDGEKKNREKLDLSPFSLPT